MNIIAFIFPLLLAATTWISDISTAKTQAAEQHKLILVNFSGSDWCGPCIRMKSEIFGGEAFSNFAAQKLVLVNADFPRMQKNKLSKDQQKRNDALAEKYNSQGKFPYTLLLDQNGKVLKTWEGLPKETSAKFTIELAHFFTDAN